MSSLSLPVTASRGPNRAVAAAMALSFVVVANREASIRGDGGSLPFAVALLGAILVALATARWLAGQRPWYAWLYFPLQTFLIQALGLLPPYQDIWALLYTMVALQARYLLPANAAIAWGAVSSTLMTATFLVTQPGLMAVGMSLTYTAVAVLVVSWDTFANQAEEARGESDRLLQNLREANERLRVYTTQVEELAAARERDRLAHEIHDSVGQMVLGIRLSTEAARLLLEKDPARVAGELERLQALTASALSQMRALITEWRPR